MARRDANGLLAALIAEADWTAGELARAVNGLGMAQGLCLRYDRTSVAHWLTGSRPRPPIPDLVAAALTQRLGRLVMPAETGLAQNPHPPDLLLTPGPGDGGAVLRLISLCRAEAAPERRAFLARSGYTLTAFALPGWLPEAAAPSTTASGAHRVAAEDVQLLQEMARVFSGLSRSHGGGHARTSLAAYIADDVSRLLDAPGPGRLRTETQVAVAQLVHLLADMTADAGRDGLAQRYFYLALSLAQQAGDRRQYAITLRAMSSQALRLLHDRHADQLAHAAIEVCGDRGDRGVHSFLLAQRALTRARRRERRAAVADLSAAESRHERAAEEGGPFAAYPKAGLYYQRAEVLLALGDDVPARAALDASLAHRSPDEHRPAALTRAKLAESLLRAGNLDEACGHWQAFFDHYPHLRSAQVDQAFTEMVRCLRPYRRQRQAGAVLERAREFAK
ncbi:tetratricopeptide repeat protein [Streptomyces sp. NBC_01304]|uniref:tetratricopeptide repeat protein n=1 Tax=Streptomyces sp. NBC_01304 TaxID=2903818 RepID=UPI002E141B9D|nr:hypothetical protein OG430_00995 [Streptomyces sp. NBC_01304]